MKSHTWQQFQFGSLARPLPLVLFGGKIIVVPAIIFKNNYAGQPMHNQIIKTVGQWQAI
jgi:hypothetical protein